jgi:hypothetical protein
MFGLLSYSPVGHLNLASHRPFCMNGKHGLNDSTSTSKHSSIVLFILGSSYELGRNGTIFI